MTQPRQVVPGAILFVTRRILRRHHLLHPDSEMRNLVVYALAVCARRYGVVIHGFCTMSTHLHIVLTDVRGVLPDFLGQLHRCIAMATKVHRKWEGPVWDHEQTSAVSVRTPEAVIDKIAYCLANPVAAGLVRYAADWPGAKSRLSELGAGVLHARRPTMWFDPEHWPDEAELRLEPTADAAPTGVDAWREAIGDALREHERAGRVAVDARGWAFLGLDRLADVSPYERAKSFEPLRSRNPTFAVGRRARQAYRAAVQSLRAFREAYRMALDSWRQGVRDVVFPVGTWWMLRVHAVTVQT